MTDSQKRILEMLAEKKISVEEAERLLSLTGKEEVPEQNTSTEIAGVKLPFKYLRVLVQPGPNAEPGQGADKVNIRVPVKLIRAGMKLTSLIPPQAADKMNEAMSEKGINFDLSNLKTEDIDELIEALSDLQVDVNDGKESVKVYAE